MPPKRLSTGDLDSAGRSTLNSMSTGQQSNAGLAAPLHGPKLGGQRLSPLKGIYQTLFRLAGTDIRIARESVFRNSVKSRGQVLAELVERSNSWHSQSDPAQKPHGQVSTPRGDTVSGTPSSTSDKVQPGASASL